MSMRPRAETVSLTRRFTSASSVSEATTGMTLAPSAFSSAARATTLSLVRAQIASEAPCAASALATACPT